MFDMAIPFRGVRCSRVSGSCQTQHPRNRGRSCGDCCGATRVCSAGYPRMRCFPYSTILPVYCHRSEDASYIVQEFHERYETTDFLQLPNYRTYVKLMVGG